MVETDKDWMLVRFKGTYTSASPSGVRGAKVVKPFDVRVKMLKELLNVPAPHSLRGPFDVNYKQIMKQHFLDMIDLDKFIMVEATELDGSKIEHPRCMSHEDAISYIQRKEYPINISLYDSQDLRHQIELYENEKALGYRDRTGQLQNGQQKNQNVLAGARGGHIAMQNKIASMDGVFEILSPTEAHHDEAIARQQTVDKKIQANKLNKSKDMPAYVNPVTEANKNQAQQVAANVEETDHNNDQQSFDDLFSAPAAS